VVAHGAFDQAGGFLGGEAVLGLADELRLADEAGDERAAAGQQVVAGDCSALRFLTRSP
jgi:hypothetical protein